MMDILREHFWAIWWLVAIVATHLPDAFIVINRTVQVVRK